MVVAARQYPVNSSGKILGDVENAFRIDGESARRCRDHQQGYWFHVVALDPPAGDRGDPIAKTFNVRFWLKADITLTAKSAP